MILVFHVQPTFLKLSILMDKHKVLVVGVGNRYRRDDGVGPAVIEYMQNQLEQFNADFLDGGIDPLNLIEPLSEYEQAILIDAAHMQKTPGTVACFSVADTDLHVKANVVSTHGFGLIELVNLVEQLNISPRLNIIAIQPEDISFGEGLTDTVKKQLPKIIDLVKKKLG